MTDTSATHTERLRPSPATWLLVPVGAGLAGASTFPLGIPVVVVTGVVVALGLVALLLATTPVVAVDAAGLRAGKAFLEARYLGEVEVLDEAQTRAALGPELRADAYVLQRSWLRRAVRVTVDDDADPTPYWLVSTRRPTELAAALGAAARGAAAERPPGDQAAHSEQTG